MKTPIHKKAPRKPIARLDDTWVFFLLFFGMFFMAASNHSEEPLEKSLLWEISGNGLEESSYLFGTYHLIEDRFLHEMPHVQSSFEAAEGVVVETILDSAALGTLAMQMIMPDNNVENLLGKKDYKLLEKIWEEKTGQSLGMMKSFKPMALYGQLVVMFDHSGLEHLIGAGGLPLDMFFAQQARSEGRTVTALESVEFQMGVLYGGDVETQAKALADGLHQIDEVDAMSRALVDSYLAQDLIAIEAVPEKYGELGTMGIDMDELVNDRNANWMEQLPELMARESQFIAVGTLHLVGEEGLIRELRKAGYTVTPIFE